MSTNAADSLRIALKTSITLTELQHARLQARLMAALLAGALMFDLLDPAVLLLAGSQGTLLATASATALGRVGFGFVFLVLATMLVPFLVLQAGHWEASRRAVTKITCFALALATMAWFFLAWRCVHLHFGVAPPLLFLRSGLGALLCSFALAFFLNAERLRSILERPSC